MTKLLVKEQVKENDLFLDHEEIQRLFTTMKEERWEEKTPYSYSVILRNECILRLMYYGCFRASDIIELRVGDIDLEKGTIHRKEGYILKIVDVELLRLILKHYRTNYPEEYVFEGISRGNKKLNKSMIDKIFDRACEKAEVRTNNFHSFRLTLTRINDLKGIYHFSDQELLYWNGYQKGKLGINFREENIEIMYQKIIKNMEI